MSFTTPEIVSMTTNTVLAIAGVATALAALRGLNRWSAEQKGKVAFEIARNLMRSVYKLRDEIENCRRPLAHGEYPDWFHQKPERTYIDTSSALTSILKERIEPVFAARQELSSHLLEVEGVFGGEVKEAVLKLVECVAILDISRNILVGTLDESFPDAGQQKRTKDIYDKVVFTSMDKSIDNPFTTQILTAVKDIEDKMLPMLRWNQ